MDGIDGIVATLFGMSGDIAGHTSYFIIAISYWLTNIFWLRVTAVVGLIFEVIYFVIQSDALYTGIAWDCVFIAINLFHLIHLTRQRLTLRAVEGDRDLLRLMFDGLDDAQIGMLLNNSSWQRVEVGEHLTVQGEPVAALMLIAAGQSSVRVDNHLIAHVGPGTFIGEMAFLTGAPASATVIATQPMRVLRIEMPRLKTLLVIDHQIAGVLHRLLGADLAQKLRARNQFAEEA
jgi:hypothetical protein